MYNFKYSLMIESVPSSTDPTFFGQCFSTSRSTSQLQNLWSPKTHDYTICIYTNVYLALFTHMHMEKVMS